MNDQGVKHVGVRVYARGPASDPWYVYADEDGTPALVRGSAPWRGQKPLSGPYAVWTEAYDYTLEASGRAGRETWLAVVLLTSGGLLAMLGTWAVRALS